MKTKAKSKTTAEIDTVSFVDFDALVIIVFGENREKREWIII